MAKCDFSSSLDCHTTQHGACEEGYAHYEAPKADISPSRRRHCVIQQTAYHKGDSRRELFSPKDVTKRKRVNRIAKLKQCKLDARREQWLAQGNHCQGQRVKHATHSVSTREGNEGTMKSAEHAELSSSTRVKARSFGGIFMSKPFDEGDVNAKKSDSNCLRTNYLIGPFKAQSSIVPNTEAGDIGGLNLLARAFKDDICENKLKSVDTEESAQRPGQSLMKGHGNQISRAASGSIHCDSGPCVTDIICFRAHACPRRCESHVSRVGIILPDPDSSAGDIVAVPEKNQARSCASDKSFQSTTFSSNGRSAGIDYKDNDLSTLENEDDWEVAADALSVPGSLSANGKSQLPKAEADVKIFSTQRGKIPGTSNLQIGIPKPEYKCKASGTEVKGSHTAGRAWRPDDTSRPPTLPRPTKELNFPPETGTSVRSGLQNVHNLWGPPPVPAHCPICTEELDLTDSSFLPCSCGFRLCLFCHHRIASDGGRCPGCRKAYSTDIAVKSSCVTPLWMRV